MDVKPSAADGTVVAQAAVAAAHPGQAQQHLSARVRRQGPRVDRQPHRLAQRHDRADTGFQLLHPSDDARLVAASYRLVMPLPARPPSILGQ